MAKSILQFCSGLLCLFLLTLGLITTALGQDEKSPVSKLKLDATTKMRLVNAQVKILEYRGRPPLHLVPPAGRENEDESMLAVLTDIDFKNGTIEVDVAGAPRQGASPAMKGFIGISFRVDGEKQEIFYIRPVNARLEDQLVRNHTAQYVSEPGYSWQRLRQENPGVYESYAEMETGAWTKLRIEVSGTKARLYVNGASQPCLIVNDLKQGESHGKIALWAHSTTEAFFSDMTVTATP